MTLAKIVVKLRHVTLFELWWSRFTLLRDEKWVQAIYNAMFCRERLPKIWFLLQQNEISLVSSIEGMKLSIFKRNISR